MLISKRRLIHATLYEGILLVVIAILLSTLMNMPLEVTGALGIAMAVTSMFWNMLFNHYFEKFEAKHRLKRTIKVRIAHAIGFEGGLMLATIPMVAYTLQTSLAQAFFLDLAMTLCILVYTFIFQWCYDHLEAKMGLEPDYRKA
ncbi:MULTISPECIES: chlorhexidine efflux PACE transporter AceI [Acinetobacter]|uniref:chlorhexidine efflux PACE transporter AceI n=1 Tax=Acinetobacter TaxID=469 RepID=UPI00257F8EA1|nr:MULTISPECIES: chlorhexidine efflux PACE transporter AceI [Acinetobacter]